MKTPGLFVAATLFFCFTLVSEAAQDVKIFNDVPHKSFQMEKGDWVSRMAEKYTGSMANYHDFKVTSPDSSKLYTTKKELGSLPIGTIVWIPVTMLARGVGMSAAAPFLSSQGHDDELDKIKGLTEDGSEVAVVSSRGEGEDASPISAVVTRPWYMWIAMYFVKVWRIAVKLASLDLKTQLEIGMIFWGTFGLIFLLIATIRGGYDITYLMKTGINTSGLDRASTRKQPSSAHTLATGPSSLSLLPRFRFGQKIANLGGRGF